MFPKSGGDSGVTNLGASADRETPTSLGTSMYSLHDIPRVSPDKCWNTCEPNEIQLHKITPSSSIFFLAATVYSVLGPPLPMEEG